MPIAIRRRPSFGRMQLIAIARREICLCGCAHRVPLKRYCVAPKKAAKLQPNPVIAHPRPIGIPLLGAIVTRQLFAVFLVTLAACGFSAHAELLPAHADSLDSALLHQKRAIEVFLPKEVQKDPQRRYETIYVLDGDWNAKLVVQTVDFLEATGFMPPVIVVSVPNFFNDKGVNSRDHDLTPTAQPGEPRSGGATQFVAFLKTELIPYVNQHYPGSGVNLVHGHSYGGLFLNYLIATDPSVFDGYVILDPAMWWGNGEVSKLLAERLPSTPTLNKAVFIAGRAGSAFKEMGVDSLQRAFEKAPRALHRLISAYPDETHDSIKFKSTYDGLRYLYRGYSQEKMSIGPDDGIFDPSLPVPIEADTDRFDIFYTTDGSTPTLSSKAMDHSLAVGDPASLRLKLIATRAVYDADIALHLRPGTIWRPVRATKDGEKSSFHYVLYAADQWPSFRGSPMSSGKTDDGDLGKVLGDDAAAIVDNDYVIPEDGYYIVVLRTSQPARATLDGHRIIQRGDAEGRGLRTFVVPLRAGVHHARAEFRYRKGDGFDFHIFHFKNGTWDNVVK